MSLDDQNLPVPTCAVCNRPVERVVAWRDPCTEQMVFVAYCHGAIETSRVELTLLHAHARDTKIEAGMAFVPAAAALNPKATP